MKIKLLNAIIMALKQCTYAFIAQVIFCQLAMATVAIPQSLSLNEVYVTLPQKEMGIFEVFREIEKQSDFRFAYDKVTIDPSSQIRVGEGKQTVANILYKVAKSNSLDFKRVNNGIDVKAAQKNTAPVVVEDVANIAISGRITDENGEPLPGATVLEKGTTNGTITDVNGKFELSAQPNAVLLISFIGYTSEEVAIGNRSTIDVSLLPDIQSLQEVVVVGYGTQKREDLTGSVVSIGKEDFNPGVNASVNQLIQGRAAGVQINQTSSEPGGGVSVRVRGASSVSAGNQPLYVIDGLPIDNGAVTPSAKGINSPTNTNSPARNPLNSLNPGDIESIEVLKDASATAIYGSRGANGVILITTKGGKNNSRNINYSMYMGVQEVANTYEMLDAKQYVQVLNELSLARGNEAVFSEADVNALGVGTNWQDEIFRSATINNHQLAFSGGGENNTYYASFNYFDQEGVISNSGLTRYATRLNLTQNFDKLTFGLNLNASYQVDEFTAFNNGGQNQQAGAIQAAVFYDPTAPVFKPNGDYNQASSMDFENPVALVKEVTNQAETNRVFGTAYLQYEFIDGLTGKINLGADKQSARRDSYYPTNTLFGSQAGGAADVSSREASNYLFEATLTYDKQINDNNKITVLGGYTYQNFINSGLGAGAFGFPTDIFLANNLGSAANNDTYTINSFKSRNQLLSYLGRVNYSLYDKFLFTGSFRVDGSSRFGANNKYGFFPSGAFAYKIGQEDFIKDLNVFSNLKFRVSYGVTGNQEIPNYLSLPLFSVRGNTATIGGQPVTSIGIVNLANPDLKWERTGQFNVGLDMGFVQGRISASVDYYLKNTEDLLFNQPQPASTGVGTQLINLGSVKNEGFELLINTINVEGDFTWNTGINFATYNNEITSIGNLETEPFVGSNGFLPNIAIVRKGEALYSYYGYEVEGVFQSGDDIANSAQPTAKPGDLKFKDINTDGALTEDDQVILGSPIPDFSLGFSNTFSYKRLSLSVFFQGSFGNELFNRNQLQSDLPPNARLNRFAEPYLNRWTVDNPTNDNPSFVNQFTQTNNSRYVEDASYVRLQNINLSYQIPVKGVSFIESADIYITGQNLFTFTNYSGVNPEANSNGDSGVAVDFNSYPVSRIYTIGANIRF